MNVGSKRLKANTDREQGKEDDVHTGELTMRVLALFGLPFTLFVLVLFGVSFLFDDWPFWVLLTLALALVKAFLASQLCTRWRWLRWLGPFLALATCAGLAIGLYVYYRHLVFYFFYKKAERHVNVAAGESALRFQHSGLLSFTSDSHVDVSRSVGYHSVSEKAKLCVAPIVDGVMAHTDAVSFFAVGVGCCGYRSDFHCGDAHDPEAHSGALVLSLHYLVTPSAAMVMEDTALTNGFKDAMSLDSAVFNITLASSTRFVHWARDPTTVPDAHLDSAILALVLWSLLVAVLGLSVALTAAAGPKRVRQFMVKDKGGDFVEESHERGLHLSRGKADTREGQAQQTRPQ